MSADVKGTETLNVDYIIRGLAQYVSPLNYIYTKGHNSPWNKKTRSLTVRRYTLRLIDLNEYLASFLGATLTDNIGVTELNEILLNSLPYSWSKQDYVQVFDCEYINFKTYGILRVYL